MLCYRQGVDLFEEKHFENGFDSEFDETILVVF